MATDTKLWGTLTGLNVTYAQRWLSAWADLLLADMALMEREQLEVKPSNIFSRRALWESAVVSYGRVGFSDQKRKIDYRDFVDEVAGKDGLALHDRVMDWRHGHVAHRRDAEFESVETVLTFPARSAPPNALEVVLSVDAGPKDESDFVTAFRQLVKDMRDAMHEKRLAPLGVSLVDDLNAGRIAWPAELRLAEDRSSEDRYVITSRIAELGPNQSSG